MEVRSKSDYKYLYLQIFKYCIYHILCIKQIAVHVFGIYPTG